MKLISCLHELCFYFNVVIILLPYQASLRNRQGKRVRARIAPKIYKHRKLLRIYKTTPLTVDICATFCVIFGMSLIWSTCFCWSEKDRFSIKHIRVIDKKRTNYILTVTNSGLAWSV